MKKSRAKLNPTHLIIALVVLILGFWFFKSILLTPQVALIGNEPAKACLTSVTSFRLYGLCAGNKVKIVNFTCANGKGSGIDGVEKCVDPIEAYNYAKDFCGRDCPTPSPSSTTCAPVDGSCVNPTGGCSGYSNSCEQAASCATPFKACPPPPSPSPSPRNCTQEAGSCLNSNKQCVTYTNGCQKYDLCGSQPKSCPKNSTRPISSQAPLPDGCHYEAVQCFQAPCEPQIVCPPTEVVTPPPDFPIYNPPNCVKFFGKSICWPNIRPFLD